MLNIYSVNKKIPSVTIIKSITKSVAYNAMGKTIFLKLLLNNISEKKNNTKQNTKKSTSQKKKQIFVEKNKKVWLLDEPFTALDYHNYIYLKSTMLEHINKNGIIIYTQNKMQHKNKIFYFYVSSYWI